MVLVGTWWYWVSIRQYWLILGGTGPVLIGSACMKWYWVSKRLVCLYILKKLMVMLTNRPTNEVFSVDTHYYLFDQSAEKNSY